MVVEVVNVVISDSSTLAVAAKAEAKLLGLPGPSCTHQRHIYLRSQTHKATLLEFCQIFILYASTRKPYEIVVAVVERE